MTRGLALALPLLTLVACGGATQVAAPLEPVPEVPPPPPADPLAWLPTDASVLGRVDLAGLRASALAQHLAPLDDSPAEWLDISLVDGVSFGVEPHGTDAPSVVGVLEGRFGPGYLEAHAAEMAGAPLTDAAHPVYVHEGSYWVQPREEMLVGFTRDHMDFVLARYTAGPDVPLRSLPLFTSLAPAVQFDDSHVAVLMQDADGSARKALDEASRGQAGFVMRALQHISQGAVRVQVTDGIAARVVGDVDEGQSAEQLRAMLQAYLDRWQQNPLIALLGLSDLLAGIGISAEGQRVSIDLNVSKAQIDSLMEKLMPLIEPLLVRPEEAAPAASVAAPSADTAPEGEADAAQ